MYQYTDHIFISTNGPSLINITSKINDFVINNNFKKGILNLFIQHTSASLVIQENADPDVLEDLLKFYSKLVPINKSYKHQAEGEDDMPAHIKSSLSNTSLSISIQNKKLTLGIWQGIFLFEHRDMPMRRKINLHFIGE